MEELQVSKTLVERLTEGNIPSGNRRKFLKNAGMATAMGFVPNILSTEKVGATKADAFVMAIPIIPCCKAIMACEPAMPK